jgi:hypothetical protein
MNRVSHIVHLPAELQFKIVFYLTPQNIYLTPKDIGQLMRQLQLVSKLFNAMVHNHEFLHQFAQHFRLTLPAQVIDVSWFKDKSVFMQVWNRAEIKCYNERHLCNVALAAVEQDQEGYLQWLLGELLDLKKIEYQKVIKILSKAIELEHKGCIQQFLNLPASKLENIYDKPTDYHSYKYFSRIILFFMKNNNHESLKRLFESPIFPPDLFGKLLGMVVCFSVRDTRDACLQWGLDYIQSSNMCTQPAIEGFAWFYLDAVSQSIRHGRFDITKKLLFAGDSFLVNADEILKEELINENARGILCCFGRSNWQNFESEFAECLNIILHSQYLQHSLNPSGFAFGVLLFAGQGRYQLLDQLLNSAIADNLRIITLSEALGDARLNGHIACVNLLTDALIKRSITPSQ